MDEPTKKEKDRIIYKVNGSIKVLIMENYDVFIIYKGEPEISIKVRAKSKKHAIDLAVETAKSWGWISKPSRATAQLIKG